MNFKTVYLWHLSNSRWEKAVEKYELISKSLQAVHQRFLNNANKGKPTRRFGNSKTN